MSAVSSATRRTSASAASASRHAATCDSNADSSAIASPNSCADSAPAGIDTPSPTARRACVTHAAALSWGSKLGDRHVSNLLELVFVYNAIVDLWKNNCKPLRVVPCSVASGADDPAAASDRFQS